MPIFVLLLEKLIFKPLYYVLTKSIIFILLIHGATVSSMLAQNDFNLESDSFFQLNSLVISEGDNFSWAEKSYDDSDWQQLKNFRPKHRFGKWWIRVKVCVSGKPKTADLLTLQCMRFFSAYNVYWDGNLIGKNGVVGDDRHSESPGKFKFPLNIDLSKAPEGEHLIALRISNYHAESNLNGAKILFGNYFDWAQALSIYVIKFFAVLTILLFSVGISFFSSVVSKKKLSYILLLSVSIVTILNHVLMNIWLILPLDSTYVWYQDATGILSIATMTILIPTYIAIKNNFQKLKYIFPLLFLNLFILLIDNFFERNLITSLSILGGSAIFIIYGLYNKEKGNKVLLTILLICLVIILFDISTGIEDLALIGTFLIIGFNINLLGEYLKKERELQKAKLRSATLENELLKKNINPHFLMNSLNSIMVWLRRDPQKAVALITELAKEFRIIQQISSEKLITISKEIEICKSHLEILNLRKNSLFSLELKELDLNEKIPPMIFHTLIENGITHGYENKNNGVFIISRVEEAKGIKYSIYNDSTPNINGDKIKAGTGYKYIQARLEESYPRKWKLDYGRQNGGWETHITIYHNFIKQ